MHHLLDIVARNSDPEPWQEGDNIPWYEPEFSARMLAEHLTQAHDHASRRTTIIDQHVAWIHQTLLQEAPAKILDLGCGPGLYAQRLADLGHQCVGIDYSPASIAYARTQAAQTGAQLAYHLADIRRADYGPDGAYDLVMLLFGEFNVFSQADIGNILTKAKAALRPGGYLLVEPHRFDSLARTTPVTTRWYSSTGGLFDPAPHVVLFEEHWRADRATLTTRYYILHAADAHVTRYAQSMQAYTDKAYAELLAAQGFPTVTLTPGLADDRLPPNPDFYALLASPSA
jgi:SAM-dependent methyltransferase